MKYLLIILTAFSLNAQAQQVPNVSLRAADWAYIGSYADGRIYDTLYMDFFDHLRVKIKAAGNVGWNTLIAVDSVPHQVLIRAYLHWKESGIDNVETNNNRLSVRVEALTDSRIVERIADYKAAINAAFIERRQIGRRFLTGK